MRAVAPPDKAGAAGTPDEAWKLETAILDYLEGAWQHPDDGLWEMRGARQHFTHSKVMAWLGFASAVQAAEAFDLPGPIDRWRAARDEVHAQVCNEGFDPELGSFTQAYGSKKLDAALLQIPATGFLPATDERMIGTVAAIEKDLLQDGFVLRYRSESGDDGLPPGEGAFLPCSFWLVGNYVMQGRHQEARALYDKLMAIANDVGLFSEEYDPAAKRLLGNVPQAFTHLAFVRAAATMSGASLVSQPGDPRCRRCLMSRGALRPRVNLPEGWTRSTAGGLGPFVTPRDVPPAGRTARPVGVATSSQAALAARHRTRLHVVGAGCDRLVDRRPVRDRLDLLRAGRRAGLRGSGR